MHIFVTGGSGFVGSKVVEQLLHAGHTVTALVRTEDKAKQLAQKGAKTVIGDLNSPEVAADAARAADGVLHLAFVHDFSDYMGSCVTEKAFVTAINQALAGTGKPFVATSGTAVVGDSGLTPANEDAPLSAYNPRGEASEIAVLKGAEDGVRAMTLRLPYYVFDKGSAAFVQLHMQAAKAAGAALYIGSGEQTWSLVHVDDAAAAYLTALEHGKAGQVYNIVAPYSISAIEMAHYVSKQLSTADDPLPVKSVTQEEAAQYYAPIIAMLFSMSNLADPSKAKRVLGWEASRANDFA